MATRAGAIGNLPWVRGTSQPGVRMAPRGAQHKEAITAELQMYMQRFGIKKFIETHGSSTFLSIAAVTAGGMIPQDTPEISKFGTLPGDQPAMEEELKELSKPVGFPDQTDWSKSYADTGTKIPEQQKPEPPDNIPPQIKTEPEGFPIPEQKTWEDYILYSKKDDISTQTKDLVPEKPKFGKLTKTETQTAKALKEGKPDFYSRAIEAIKTAEDDKYTKGRWASILKSNTTKNELDYLGLTKLLVGDESITKQELLKFVESKDIAPNITVRSIPKDEMNKMYEQYSLGGYTFETQEQIVFQIGVDPAKDDIPLQFREPHFSPEYAYNTFAHARIQVGYDKLEHEQEHIYQQSEDEETKIFYDNIEKTFKNTLIIDEIQSEWLQEIQKNGAAKDWKVYRGDKIPTNLKEEFDYPYPLPNHHYVFDGKNNFINSARTDEEAYEVIENKAVPDFPIKESKKWVELVLNKMIEKAILDGRNSIAITNGQIQANRYEAMDEEKKQGLKKFYDTIVNGQLEKIAKKYNVKLERINLKDPEEAVEDQQDFQLRIPKTVKEAQDQGYTLQKLSMEILDELANNRDLPGHASLYSNQGRGQGVDYILDNLRTPSGVDVRKKINYYIWTKENISEDINNLNVSRDFKNIVWDMPIVPVADTITNPAVKDLLNASSEDREYILKQFTVGGAAAYPYEGENINNIDLIQYTEYLRNYKPPEGVDLGYDKDVEQLIKMKLPKKLQKERLSKPIRLTKVKQQTERLFA